MNLPPSAPHTLPAARARANHLPCRPLCLLLFALAASGAPAQPGPEISVQGEPFRLEWMNEEPGFIMDQRSTLGGEDVWRPYPLYPLLEANEAWSVPMAPFDAQRFFRLREDVPPTEIRRSLLNNQAEVLAWDFTYRGFRLEFSDDDDLWQPVFGAMEIDYETGEFKVELPVSPPGRAYRLRGNEPPTLSGLNDVSVPIGEEAVFPFPAADPDGDPLRYQVTGLPPGASFNPISNELVFKPETGSSGVYTVTVIVSDSVFSTSADFTLTVPTPPPRTTTALSGTVLDAHAGAAGQQTPIVGVTVTLMNTGASTTTDATGEFAFEDVPAGLQVLNFDPTLAQPGPAGAVYAGFRKEITLLPLIANRINRPIYLPQLATSSLTQVVTTETTVVENTDIGVSLTILPNTALTGDTSLFDGQLSISEVPRGFEPASMPPGLQPDMLVTIQPVGVRFSRPAAITFPNRLGFAPGEQVEIWSLDPGTGQFAVVGMGQVSPNGQDIVTISGGVVATDWHFVAPIPAAVERAIDFLGLGTKCPAGSEITLHTGDLTTEFASPAWFSLGTATALGFEYSSRQARPEFIAPLEISLRPGAPAPTAVALSAVDPRTGTVTSPTWIDGTGLANGGSLRSGVSFRAFDSPTGIHTFSVEALNQWGLGPNAARRGGSFDLEAPVVNRSQSPYGMGWSVAGVQSIHVNPDLPEVALVVEGSRSAPFSRRVNFSTTPVFEYGTPLELPANFDRPQGFGDQIIADLDDDGIPDLILRSNNSTESRFAVYRGRGDGSFEFQYQRLVVNRSDVVKRMVGHDFDGDGRLDLAFLSSNGAVSSAHILLGLGGGVFSSVDEYVLGAALLASLAVGDIDGDGIADLAASRDPAPLVLLRGVGDGTFEAPVTSSLASGSVPSSITLTDMNGDGRADLIGRRNDGIYLAVSDGAGDFLPPVKYGAFTVGSIHVGDFRGDSRPEILFANSVNLQLLSFDGAAFTWDGVVGVLPQAATSQASGQVLDIDGDGHLDALVGTAFNQLAVAYGDGQGAFDLELIIPLPPVSAPGQGGKPVDVSKTATFIAAEDLNNNGRTDLVIAVEHVGFSAGDFVAAAVVLGGPGRTFQAPQYAQGKLLQLNQTATSWPKISAVGDFNNDGIDDVLSASSFSANAIFTLQPGLGNGSFAPGTVALATGQGRAALGTSIAVADFDLDGNLDVLYATINAWGLNVVRWGRGDGTFEVEPGSGIDGGWQGLEVGVPRNVEGFAAGDVNGDGFPDFVAVRWGSVPTVYLYDPGSPRTFLGPFPIDVDTGYKFAAHAVPGDLNGDGLMDVVFFEQLFQTDRSSLFYAAYVSQGDGTFLRVQPDFSGFTQGSPGSGIPWTYDLNGTAWDAAIADLNGDGKQDLAFTTAEGLWTMNGDGTGVLAAPGLVPSAPGVAQTLGLVDLTGDGAPEAVINIAQAGPRQSYILPNIGGRQIFGDPIPIATGFQQPYEYVGADVNLDGRNDVIVVSGGGNGGGGDWPVVPLLNVLHAQGFEPTVAVSEPVTYDSPAGDFSTLTLFPDGTWQRRMRDGTVVLFDDRGRQVSVADRRGRTALFSYEGDSDRLSTIVDPAGRTVVFNYSGATLASVDTPAGTLTMRYDEGGGGIGAQPAPGPRLTSVTMPGGAVRRFTYATLESSLAQ